MGTQFKRYASELNETDWQIFWQRYAAGWCTYIALVEMMMMMCVSPMCHVTTDQDLSFSMAVRSHGQWWCSPALHLWLVSSRLLDSRPVHRQHRAVHMSAVSAPKLCQPGIQIHFSPQSRLNLVLKFLDTHKLNMLMVWKLNSWLHLDDMCDAVAFLMMYSKYLKDPCVECCRNSVKEFDKDLSDWQVQNY